MSLPLLIKHAKAAFQAGVCAVHPTSLMTGTRRTEAEAIMQTTRHVYIATIGKAAAPWGQWWASWAPVEAGCIIVPAGYGASTTGSLPTAWKQVEAGHPHPTDASAQAGRMLLNMARSCRREDLFIIGLSGGGSACTALPPVGVSMQEVQMLNRGLLDAGCAIDAINAVRKHVLQVGGGRLAAAAHPGRVWCQAISDVPGDDLATIASGPTVGDPTTYQDAISVLQEAALWTDIPSSIRDYIADGARGVHPETISPGDERLSRSHTSVIANNNDACQAASSYLTNAGYATRCVDDPINGRARKEGEAHAQSLLNASESSALIWGGEPTVEVTGSGKGGRNQEAALAAVRPLARMNAPAVLLCAGTDGIDGPTNAAGAWGTPETLGEAATEGINPDAYLADNDSYTFFDRVGGLYQPGPTGTNVMDLHIGLRGKKQSLHL